METFSLSTLIIFLIVVIIIFFALREVNCWYWKINKRIELQTETNNLLRKIVNQTIKKETKIIDPKILSTEITDLNDPKVMEAIRNKMGGKE